MGDDGVGAAQHAVTLFTGDELAARLTWFRGGTGGGDPRRENINFCELASTDRRGLYAKSACNTPVWVSTLMANVDEFLRCEASKLRLLAS